MTASVKSLASIELYDRAAAVTPGSVNSCRRKIDPPICFRRGEGGYVEDLDGRRYVDYHAAYGAILHGHAHPPVVDAVREVIDQGVLFGVGTTENEYRLAEKLVEHVPSMEQALLCNTGSEATLHLIRLARGVTRRQKILKFQGCYHGFHDYVLRNNQSPAERVGKRDPGSAGMLEGALDATLVARFNDLESVEATMRENPGEIAAVIVEPIAHNSPAIIGTDEFLAGLREICDREGSLLIFDEIVTGFRHHIGGYQAISGVTPDLTAVGKGLGNGFPVAALGGRRELMERFNCHPDGDVFFGGTYCGNQVGLAAGLATIELLEDGSAHQHLFALGDRMRDGLRAIVEELGVPALVSGYGSIYILNFWEGELHSYDDVVQNDRARQIAYRRELIARGIFEIPEAGGRNHIMVSHTEDDIDRSLEAAAAALRAVFP
ncbi:MAG TPA: aspartate aminotransferase family protein [Conexibacter sp.]|nr:aspartate aminotransferase family protein [Conexibacter sp.]